MQLDISTVLFAIASILIAGLLIKFGYKIYGYLYITLFFRPTGDFDGDMVQLDNQFKVQGYLDDRIKYRTDKEFSDYWKNPEDTWEDGYSDCEDEALLAGHCLHDKYNVRIFCAYPEDENGHATLLVKHSYYWETLGTKGYNLHLHTNYKKLGKFFYPDFYSYSLYTWDGEFIFHNYNHEKEAK